MASGIAEQPIGLALTAEGARNRAVAAYAEACRVLPPAARSGAVLALGIESGIFEVSGGRLRHTVAHTHPKLDNPMMVPSTTLALHSPALTTTAGEWPSLRRLFRLRLRRHAPPPGAVVRLRGASAHPQP